MSTPADAVAAAVCYLARWRGSGRPAALVDRVTFFHPERCRFCDEDPAKLLELCRSVDAGSRAGWSSLPSGARMARIREAQRPSWWEDYIADEPPA